MKKAYFLFFLLLVMVTSLVTLFFLTNPCLLPTCPKKGDNPSHLVVDPGQLPGLASEPQWTRQDMAKSLVEGLKASSLAMDLDGHKAIFDDVPKNHPFNGYINLLTGQSKDFLCGAALLSAEESSNFLPEDKVIGQDLFKLLSRLAKQSATKDMAKALDPLISIMKPQDAISPDKGKEIIQTVLAHFVAPACQVAPRPEPAKPAKKPLPKVAKPVYRGYELTVPHPTKVDDTKFITEKERQAVIAEIEKANPKLVGHMTEITIYSDGSGKVIFDDQSYVMLKPAHTICLKDQVPDIRWQLLRSYLSSVIPMKDLFQPNYLYQTYVVDPKALTQGEQALVETAVRYSYLQEGALVEVVVSKQGDAYVLFSDGSFRVIEGSKLVIKR